MTIQRASGRTTACGPAGKGPTNISSSTAHSSKSPPFRVPSPSAQLGMACLSRRCFFFFPESKHVSDAYVETSKHNTLTGRHC